MIWKGCSYLRKKIKIDCNEVIQAFLNFDFCEGKLHAQKNHFDIVLGYEYNAVPHERAKNIIHPLEEVPLDDKPEEASAKHVNGDKNIVFPIPEKGKWKYKSKWKYSLDSVVQMKKKEEVENKNANNKK